MPGEVLPFVTAGRAGFLASADGAGAALPETSGDAVEPLRQSDPQRVGRYQILGRLGAGGMGVVYLADGPRGRVALKLVRAELSDDHQFRVRFRREVQASFRVSSDHTAKLIDFDTEAEQAWMATEYVDGQPLDEMIDSHGPYGVDEQLRFASGLAEALAAIHAQDIIHRDLKPSNVLCTGLGPKLIDFGIAAAADAARITSTGLMIGSPGWLAPEQIATGEATPASDVFALGLVLAYAASGRPPYGTGPTEVLFYRTLNEPPTLDLNRITPALQDPLRAATARQPADRPTATDLVSLFASGGGAWTPLPQPLHDSGGTMIERVGGGGGDFRADTIAPPAQHPRFTPPPMGPPPGNTPPPIPAPRPGAGFVSSTGGGDAAVSGPRRRLALLAGGMAVVVAAVVGGVVVLSGTNHSTPPPPTPSSADPVAHRANLTNAALVGSADWSGKLGNVNEAFVQGPCPAATLSPDVSVPVRSLHSTDSTSNYLQENVAVFDSPAAATDFAARAATAWRACTPFDDKSFNGGPEHVTLSLPSSPGVGDDSVYRTATYAPVGASSYTSVWMLMRKGSVVVGLTGYTADETTAVDQFRGLLDKAAQRIAAVG